MAEPTGKHVGNTCLHCKRSLRAHFEIQHVNPDRQDPKPPPIVRVCSIKCLMGWAYAYTARRGTQGIMMFKNAINKITQTVKGKD